MQFELYLQSFEKSPARLHTTTASSTDPADELPCPDLLLRHLLPETGSGIEPEKRLRFVGLGARDEEDDEEAAALGLGPTPSREFSASYTVRSTATPTTSCCSSGAAASTACAASEAQPTCAAASGSTFATKVSDQQQHKPRAGISSSSTMSSVPLSVRSTSGVSTFTSPSSPLIAQLATTKKPQVGAVIAASDYATVKRGPLPRPS